MMARLVRTVKHMVILLAVSAFAGTALLTLAFCIPTDGIRKHVAASLENMGRDEDAFSGNPISAYIWKHREGYTDSIMVQYAFEKIPGRNAFEHAMWAYHYDLEDGIWAAEDSLRAVLSDADTSKMYLREYSRYWHGYLVYLKPLLLIFSWEQLLWLGAAFQGALMAALAVAACRKRQYGLAVAAAVGALFMKPELMVASFTMSVCWMITLMALLFMLFRGDWLREKGFYPEFFLCIGILTAYFDFLTYPAVTLGFPLCACFLMSRQGVWDSLKRLAGYSASWGIGYAGMWGAKWVIADVTLHTGTIRDAIWNVIGRTEAIGGRGISARINGGMHAIELNLQEYDWSGYRVLLLLGAALLSALILCCLFRRIPLGQLLQAVVPFLVIAAIPFVWIVAVQHHSALHARFTFRIIGVAAMAAASAGAAVFQQAFPLKKAMKNPEILKK